MFEGFVSAYQWDLRPQSHQRPGWFKAWPQGARLAFQIIVLHEWTSAPRHQGRPMPADSFHKLDFLGLGVREYGARQGIWRLLDILDRHDVKATILTSGLVGKLFPQSVRDARERGHEIASHGWDQAVHPPVFKSRAEEGASLAQARAALEEASGGSVVGYMSPGPRPTPHTLELLAEQGVRWTADYLSSDLPQLLTVKQRRIVSVGYTPPGCNDGDLIFLGAAQGLVEAKYTFDAIYEESRQHPMRFCYIAHTHWSGTPSFAKLLDDLLAYVRSFDQVWFARCIDIADFWDNNSQSA
jgi:peptidoglycan/xylan/chitin deacetylase (PgdA/CDA1 family)